MKITSIETLRTEEFSNVIWVRVHTDTGVIGLGETFYGAGAVEAQIHDTFAGRKAHSARAGSLQADLVRGPDPDELAAGARRIRALDRCVGHG